MTNTSGYSAWVANERFSEVHLAMINCAWNAVPRRAHVPDAQSTSQLTGPTDYAHAASNRKDNRSECGQSASDAGKKSSTLPSTQRASVWNAVNCRAFVIYATASSLQIGPTGCAKHATHEDSPLSTNGRCSLYAVISVRDLSGIQLYALHDASDADNSTTDPPVPAAMRY